MFEGFAASSDQTTEVAVYPDTVPSPWPAYEVGTVFDAVNAYEPAATTATTAPMAASLPSLNLRKPVKPALLVIMASPDLVIARAEAPAEIGWRKNLFGRLRRSPPHPTRGYQKSSFATHAC
jgi:hypothetical protein